MLCGQLVGQQPATWRLPAQQLAGPDHQHDLRLQMGRVTLGTHPSRPDQLRRRGCRAVHGLGAAVEDKHHQLAGVEQQRGIQPQPAALAGPLHASRLQQPAVLLAQLGGQLLNTVV